MFQKINIPQKNIVLKEDYYIKLFNLKLKQREKSNLKIKLIHFINGWS